MAIINLKEIGLGFTIRKKLNKPADVNPLKPNSRVNAFPTLLPGVYKVWRRYGKITNWRCNFWVQPYPGSAKQSAHQAIFREGLEAWRLLTSSQKQVYKVKSYGKPMTGYNVFMKEFLLGHEKLLQEAGSAILQEDNYKIYAR